MRDQPAIPKRKMPFRDLRDRVLAVLGLLVVVLQTAYLAIDPVSQPVNVVRLQVAVVGIGLLINQFGVWHLANRMVSSRKAMSLREEVDRFLDLVRRLHSQGADCDEHGAATTVAEMHESVDTMVELVPGLSRAEDDSRAA